MDMPSVNVNGFNSESHDSLPTSSNHFHEDVANGFNSLNNTPFLSSGTDSFDFASSALFLDDLNGGLPFSSEQDGLLSVPGEESPSHSDDNSTSCSDPFLKYISQMLMEENVEEKAWVFPGDFALQDTEKSFFDVLGENPLVSSYQTREIDVTQFLDTPTSNLSGSSSDHQSSAGTTITNTNSSSSIDPSPWLYDLRESNHVLPQPTFPSRVVPQLNFNHSSQLYENSVSHQGNGLMDSSVVVKKMFSDAESVLQFNKGVEEARKFLPDSTKLLINFENNSNSGFKRGDIEVGVHNEKNGAEVGSRGRKNREREEESEEARAYKQSASNVEETELAELFDKVVLWKGRRDSQCANGEMRGSNGGGGRGRGRRGGSKSSVDLRSLLVLCAQAVSTYDLRTANELLKQIRQNSSPNGDGSERIAHYFANGLEARLGGSSQSGTLNYFASLATKRVSVAEVLRSYHLSFGSCPFKKFPIIYGNCLISQMAEKATVVHIIDFGISFGFQWPILIQQLGERTKQGHPPLVKLRITGIEFPQPGFRPAEKIEETGRRLACYCHRFGVPFEYNALPSRSWETIRVEDLKVERYEFVAVNSLIRFKNLLDETVEEDSPRDAVLNLIRKIKPDVFVHTISNGSYNAPFFVTRFRAALFHLSSNYDMFDAVISSPSNNEMRVVLEREIYGREIMNVVACEGPDRVDRPETYKQWQVRHLRAGFKQLPLCQEIMDKLRVKLKTYYHKEFVLDEDGNWMLLGWKGRIMYAAACWVPA